MLQTDILTHQISSESEWLPHFEEESCQLYMRNILLFLESEEEAGHTIFPPQESIFSAFNLTPLDQVKVVIIGQDPYHGPGQAHGLAFSVLGETKIPPSLRNIYKELHSDLGIPTPSAGDLTSWARQGVLLLNTTLTVRQGAANSHKRQGWEKFTDYIMEVLLQRKEPIIFALWGAPAQDKGTRFLAQYPDHSHHLLLAPHPSPLSAYRGFFGCGHFSKINQILRDSGREEIDWRLP